MSESRIKRVRQKQLSPESDKKLREELGINPNYKGRISKYVKPNVSFAYKNAGIIDNPLRYIENKNKIEKEIISKEGYSKLIKLVTFILLSVTSIFLKYRNTYTHFKKIHDITNKNNLEIEKNKIINDASYSFFRRIEEEQIQIEPKMLDTVLSYIKEYIRVLFNPTFKIQSISSIFNVLSIFTEELPTILSLDVNNVKDISPLIIGQKLAANAVELEKVFKEDKRPENYNYNNSIMSQNIEKIMEKMGISTHIHNKQPLPDTNKGLSIMQRMGFVRGTGLGKSNTSILSPIKETAHTNTLGLGYIPGVSPHKKRSFFDFFSKKEETPQRRHSWSGGKVNLKLNKGTLTKFGYHANCNVSERHLSLEKAVKKYSKTTVIHKLNAVKLLTKNTNPKVSKIFGKDIKYLQSLK